MESVGSVFDALLLSDELARKAGAAVDLAEDEILLFLFGVVDLRGREEILVVDAEADVVDVVLADVARSVEDRVARIDDIVPGRGSVEDCDADEEAFS